MRPPPPPGGPRGLMSLPPASAAAAITTTTTLTSSSSSLSSVASWLGSQLEQRGIDAVIYTRYILSILQQDSIDIAADLSNPITSKAVDVESALSKVSGGLGRQRSWPEKRHPLEGDLDTLRKTAAVHCLRSISEEESAGIESLVEELYTKIKEHDTYTEPSTLCFDSNKEKTALELEEDGNPAERYYAAFPALSDKCDELKPKPAITPEKPWAKVAMQTVTEETAAPNNNCSSPSKQNIGHSNQTKGPSNESLINQQGPSNKAVILHACSPSKQEKDLHNMESKYRHVAHVTIAARQTPPWVETVAREKPRRPAPSSSFKQSPVISKEKKKPDKKSPFNSPRDGKRQGAKGKAVDQIKGKALFRETNSEGSSPVGCYVGNKKIVAPLPPTFIVPKVPPKVMKTAPKPPKSVRCQSEDKTTLASSRESAGLKGGATLKRSMSDSNTVMLICREVNCEEDVRIQEEDLTWMFVRAPENVAVSCVVPPRQRLYERLPEEEKDEEQGLVEQIIFGTSLHEIEEQLEALPAFKPRLYERKSLQPVELDEIDIIFEEKKMVDAQKEESCKKEAEDLAFVLTDGMTTVVEESTSTCEKPRLYQRKIQEVDVEAAEENLVDKEKDAWGFTGQINDAEVLADAGKDAWSIGAQIKDEENLVGKEKDAWDFTGHIKDDLVVADSEKVTWFTGAQMKDEENVVGKEKDAWDFTVQIKDEEVVADTGKDAWSIGAQIKDEENVVGKEKDAWGFTGQMKDDLVVTDSEKVAWFTGAQKKDEESSVDTGIDAWFSGIQIEEDLVDTGKDAWFTGAQKKEEENSVDTGKDAWFSGIEIDEEFAENGKDALFSGIEIDEEFAENGKDALFSGIQIDEEFAENGKDALFSGIQIGDENLISKGKDSWFSRIQTDGENVSKNEENPWFVNNVQEIAEEELNAGIENLNDGVWRRYSEEENQSRESAEKEHCLFEANAGDLVTKIVESDKAAESREPSVKPRLYERRACSMEMDGEEGLLGNSRRQSVEMLPAVILEHMETRKQEQNDMEDMVMLSPRQILQSNLETLVLDSKDLICVDVNKVLDKEQQETECSCAQDTRTSPKDFNFFVPCISIDSSKSSPILGEGSPIPPSTENHIPDDRPFFFISESDASSVCSETVNVSDSCEQVVASAAEAAALDIVFGGGREEEEEGSTSVTVVDWGPLFSVAAVAAAGSYTTEELQSILSTSCDSGSSTWWPPPSSTDHAAGCLPSAFSGKSSSQGICSAAAFCWTNDYGASISLWEEVQAQVQSPRPTSSSSLRNFLSSSASATEPIGGRTSQIWNVNVSQQLKNSMASGAEFEIPLLPAIYHQVAVSTLWTRNGVVDTSAFIEGGLYGNAWGEIMNSESGCTEPTASSLTVSSSTVAAVPSNSSISVDGDSSDDSVWSGFSLHPPLSTKAQRSTSADMDETPTPHLSCPINKFTGSIEILPSENSAFSDEFVHRKHLPHVQSEPVMTPCESLDGTDPQLLREVKAKLVQIKHLYKSDTDILRQLGLAVGSDDDEVSQNDSLEYSPNHHFKPISTPPPTPENSPLNSSDTLSTVVSLSSTLDGEVDASLTGVMSSSGYQLYQGEETHDVKFVPSFKVHQETDKFIQTIVCPGSNEEDYEDESIRERLIEDVKRMLQVEEEGEEEEVDGEEWECITLSELHEVTKQAECSSDYESMVQEVSGDELNCTGLASLWNTSKESYDTAPPSDSESTDVKFKNIWSVGENSTQIPAFNAALNAASKINDPDQLLEAYAAAIDNFEEYLLHDWNGVDGKPKAIFDNPWNTDHNGKEHNNDEQNVDNDKDEELVVAFVKNSQNSVTLVASASSPDLLCELPKFNKWSTATEDEKKMAKSWKELDEDLGEDIRARFSFDRSDDTIEEQHEWLCTFGDDVFIMDDIDMIGHSAPAPEQPKGNNVVYSDELEQKWFSFKTQFEVQVPKKKPKAKLGPWMKPCSFFLEGNCRRSDCKFAHDMAKITCRFWEEGECFKGPTCPFLHGYQQLNQAHRRKSKEEDIGFVDENMSDFKLEKDEFPELPLAFKEEADKKVSAGESSGKSPRVPFLPPSKSTTTRKEKSRPIDIKKSKPK